MNFKTDASCTNDAFFVMLPHVMFDSENKVTPEELYLYYFLHTIRLNIDFSKVFANVDLIAAAVKFIHNIRANENKGRIKEVLLSLQDKGYIHIDTTKEAFGYKDTLKISLRQYSKEFIKANKGFTKIYPEVYQMTDDPDKFMVLTIIKRYAKIDHQIAYTQFAEVTGRSEKHVKSLIKTLEAAGTISVDHGKYYLTEGNKVRQEINGYKIGPSHETETKSAPKAEKKLVQFEDDINSEKRPHNWYKPGARLNKQDFIVFLTTTDKELKEKAKGRIRAISGNQSGEKKLNELREIATVQIRKEQLKRDEEHYNIVDIPDWATAEEPPISFAEVKSRRQKENESDDISDLLDDNDQEQTSEDDLYPEFRQTKACVPA